MKTLNSIPANTQITLVAVAFFAIVMLVNYITWFA
jgi:hypothetical protein